MRAIACNFVRRLTLITPFALWCASALNVAGYDDSESYTNGQVLATTTSNVVAGSRWGRFGAATADNPVAVTNLGVAASTAARFPLNWGSGNNGNLVFWFDAPLDLTSAPGVVVRLQVSTLLSNTIVKAGFEQPDGTTWQLTTGQALTNTDYATFSFNFTSGAMTRTSGSGSFGLTNIRDLRLRFENSDGTGSQQVLVDNFGALTSSNAVLISDNFDTGNTFGSAPTGWVITAPAGTTARIVDNTVTAPSSSPYCTELTDNSATQQPQIHKSFTPALSGSASVAVKIPTVASAPLSIGIHTSTGQFLFRAILASNGWMQYDNTGSNTVSTTVPWASGVWQTVSINWFSDGSFDAYLDSRQFANTVGFSNAVPGRILLQAGFDTATNRTAYVDNVVVTRQVLLSSRGLFRENAMWLSGNYRNSISYVNLVPSLAQEMKNHEKVVYWFVNMGSVGTNGFMKSPGSELSQVPNFLNTVKNWENQNGFRFVLIAWLNATITNATGPDVMNPTTRTNIAGECKKFVSTSTPGSYVAGATRTFDGVHFDFEPSGGDTDRFNSLLLLMDQTRAAMASGGLPNGGHISFAASRYAVGSSSQARWSPDFYYQMGQKIDSIGVMLYDTTITNPTTFQNLIRDQTTNTLRAVSGAYWNDISHPAPTNHPLVFMGFAAYPGTSDHDPTVENTRIAAQGADAGITDLVNRADLSVNYFGGAIVFKHTDGTGNDGAASYTNDWQRFQEKWLWGCEECFVRNDPPDLTSTLRVLSIDSTNNDVHLTWATVGGKTNVVQAAAGNSSGDFTNNFTDISTPMIFPGTGEVLGEYLDAGAATTNAARYYRIRVSP